MYGYEEALGLLRRPGCRPRQGRHRAAVLACDLAAGLKAAGGGLPDRLDELATAHGVHATAGLSLRMEPAARDAVVERLRAQPPAGWAATAPRRTCSCCGARRRRAREHRSERASEERTTPGSRPSAGDRVVVRPSGTEPKLKAYLQVVEPVSGDLAGGPGRGGRAHGRPARRGRGADRAAPDPAAVITAASLPPVPRPKVHDAALRLRLLECAGATLSTRGLAALSLRTLAADVGTSTTAVYALFGGKPGLLAALHAEAFARLGARLDAVPVGADPVEDLVALGRAYRDAALADPHFYEVMFGGALPADEQWWAVGGTAFCGPSSSWSSGRRPAARCARDVDAATVSLALWATVHGLVSLHLRGLHPADAPAPDEVVRPRPAGGRRGWLGGARHCHDAPAPIEPSV